jgi:hypothetical protein
MLRKMLWAVCQAKRTAPCYGRTGERDVPLIFSDRSILDGIVQWCLSSYKLESMGSNGDLLPLLIWASRTDESECIRSCWCRERRHSTRQHKKAASARNHLDASSNSRGLAHGNIPECVEPTASEGNDTGCDVPDCQILAGPAQAAREANKPARPNRAGPRASRAVAARHKNTRRSQTLISTILQVQSQADPIAANPGGHHTPSSPKIAWAPSRLPALLPTVHTFQETKSGLGECSNSVTEPLLESALDLVDQDEMARCPSQGWSFEAQCTCCSPTATQAQTCVERASVGSMPGLSSHLLSENWELLGDDHLADFHCQTPLDLHVTECPSVTDTFPLSLHSLHDEEWETALEASHRLEEASAVLPSPSMPAAQDCSISIVAGPIGAWPHECLTPTVLDAEITIGNAEVVQNGPKPVDESLFNSEAEPVASTMSGSPREFGHRHASLPEARGAYSSPFDNSMVQELLNRLPSTPHSQYPPVTKPLPLFASPQCALLEAGVGSWSEEAECGCGVVTALTAAEGSAFPVAAPAMDRPPIALFLPISADSESQPGAHTLSTCTSLQLLHLGICGWQLNEQEVSSAVQDTMLKQFEELGYTSTNCDHWFDGDGCISTSFQDGIQVPHETRMQIIKLPARLQVCPAGRFQEPRCMACLLVQILLLERWSFVDPTALCIK